jgi:hypothetical protein
MSIYGAGVFKALSPHYMYYFWSVSTSNCGGLGWTLVCTMWESWRVYVPVVVAIRSGLMLWGTCWDLRGLISSVADNRPDVKLGF